MAGQYATRFSSPLRKLAACFEKSRDGWKTKYQELKKKAKKLENQTRAVEKSRECWRSRAEEAEQRADVLRQQVDELQSAAPP